MWASIAKFELGYQLKSPTFWISFLIFFGLAFGAISAPQVQIVGGGNVFKNAPVAIVIISFLLTLFYMFVTTAFGAGMLIRDQETGFSPLLLTTRMSKGDYVFGRMIGGFVVCALCFLSVPLGMLVGTLMPWLDPEKIGPTTLAPYVYGYAFIALPSILFMVALFGTAASLTRSMMGSYLCAVGLFIVYMGIGSFVDKSDLAREIFAWVDPFGSGAISKVIRYWTPQDSNTKLPGFATVIVGNRLLYAAAGIALMGLTRALLRFDTASGKSKKQIKAEKKTTTVPAAPVSAPLARPRFGPASDLSILITRTKFEVGQVVSGPVFIILMLLGLAFTGLTAMTANQIYGTDIYPVTRVMVSAIGVSFVLFAMISAIFYSGELVWRERSRRIDEIIDATAIPNWAYVVPKTIALGIVLFCALLVSVFGDVCVQVFKGYTHFEFGKYLVWYVLPMTLTFLLTAVLSMFIQSLSPNKFVGWGIMVVWIIAGLVGRQFGFDHKLYTYGASPYLPMSDMNGLGHFWAGWLVFKLYWTCFAVVLLVIAHILWRRGKVPSLRARVAAAPRRLKGGAGIILALSLVAFASLGAWIFYNTNVLNHYYTKGQMERNQVAFEKTFTPVVDLPVPAVVDVKLDVALYPHDLKMVSNGTYVLENKTATPISKLYLQSPFELNYKTLTLDGAHLEKNYGQFAVRLYAFDKPMQPGERRTLRFTAEQQQKGFGNDGITTRIVDNGTFLTNGEVGPSIGIRSAQQMED